MWRRTLLNSQSWQYSPISLYSKGTRRRLLIAAALLHDPTLLIFDEPLSGFDAVSGRMFKGLLELLAAPGEAVYISDALEIIEPVCNPVIAIAKATILADPPLPHLTKLMSHPSLECVFALLVQQQDTRSLAHEMVEGIRITHV